MAEEFSPSSSSPPPLPPSIHLASLQSQELLSLRSSPPPLPPSRTFDSPSVSYNSPRKRHNHHLLQTEESLPSSDPAYFSSDDIANASVENYTVERKKRRYQGSWWEHNQHQHHLANVHALNKAYGESVIGSEEITVKKLQQQQQQQQPKSKGFSRNFDSGVWMGSDDSEEQFDGGDLRKEENTEEEEARQRSWILQNKDGCLNNSNLQTAVDDEYKQQSKRDSTTLEAKCRWIDEISAEEQSARKTIARCLEYGYPNVDLSRYELKSISSETLRPLHQLIRMPLAALEVPVEEAYRRLVPLLKLFLGRNNLNSLPPELWKLKHLRVLSLRNNNLRFLSPSIARLKSLEALNISTNGIRYLPWEMLSLLVPMGKLRHPTIDSNHFLVSDNWDILAKEWRARRNYREFNRFRHVTNHDDIAMAMCNSFCFATSTPAAYFAGNGLPLPHSKQRPYSHLARDESASETEIKSQVAFYRVDEESTQLECSVQRNGTGRIPSLFELSLRSVAVNCETLPSSLSLIDHDETDNTVAAGATIPLPAAVKAGLDEVRQVWNDGGRNCSVCRRPYINPRSEWLEAWCELSHFHRSGSLRVPFYPFLRRCCGCIDPVNTFALGKAYSDCEWHASVIYYERKPGLGRRGYEGVF